MLSLRKQTRLTGYIFLSGILLLSITGCRTPEEYVEDADKDVYQIIDQKWQDDFGYKANYKINNEPNALAAVKMVPPSGVLDLEQAVLIATKFNRTYQSRKESLYNSALSLTLTRHEYAPQLFGAIDAFYNFDGDAGDSPMPGNTEETTLNAEAGVDQQILIGDMMLISANLTTDWFRYLTGDPETSLSSVLSATLTAPLWGSGAAKIAREELTQAERNVLYDIRSFNRYRKDFVVSIISDYYAVLQQKTSLDIQKASYERLTDSTNELRLKVEVGQGVVYELAEAEQRLLTAEQGVVSAVQQYEQTLDRFKISLALPTDIDIQLDPNELYLLRDIGISQPDYSVEEAIEMALDQRLDLANVRDGLDDAERQLILAADGLGPQVEFIATADVDSTPDTEFTRLRFHDGAYSAGISADLGLDQKSERNAYRRALISVQQQQRSYDQTIDDIKLQVRDDYRNLIRTAESYRIQRIGVELAQKRLEEQRLSLQYGRGVLRLLLESEDDLVQAQDDAVGALVDHMIAKLSFFRDVGILRVQPDGMWERANYEYE